MPQTSVGRTRTPCHPDDQRIAEACKRSGCCYIDAVQKDLARLRAWCWRNFSDGQLKLAVAMDLLAAGGCARTKNARLAALRRAKVVHVVNGMVVMPHYFIDEADRARGLERIEKRRQQSAAKAQAYRKRQRQGLSKPTAQPPAIVEEKLALPRHKQTPNRECEKQAFALGPIPQLDMSKTELDDLCDSIADLPMGVDRKRSETDQVLDGMDPELAASLKRLQGRLKPTAEQPEPKAAAAPVRTPTVLSAKQGKSSASARPKRNPIHPGQPVTVEWIAQNVASHPRFADLKPGVVARMGLGQDSLRVAFEQLLECPKPFGNPAGALVHAARRFQSGSWGLWASG